MLCCVVLCFVVLLWQHFGSIWILWLLEVNLAGFGHQKWKSWGHFGSLGAILGGLGANLGGIGAKLEELGPKLRILRPTWAVLEANLGHLGASLGGLGGQVGGLGVNLGGSWSQLGRFWSQVSGLGGNLRSFYRFYTNLKKQRFLVFVKSIKSS